MCPDLVFKKMSLYPVLPPTPFSSASLLPSLSGPDALAGRQELPASDRREAEAVRGVGGTSGGLSLMMSALPHSKTRQRLTGDRPTPRQEAAFILQIARFLMRL
ncbi:hypothetical protein XENORESO_002221 [Xenotaenia resolanae]|uniref:Uncharacterized protein n=1 Tax=Xenotaenia resolanae TaxID=208358 RepID=A0ABV0WKB9_9TELE